MRVANGSKSVVSVFFAALVLLAGTVWAANKGSLDLLHPTSVAGTTLASGSYTVRWEGSGDQVDVTIYQGKKQVATTSGHIVQLDSPAEHSSAIVSMDGSGSATLSQIRFAGTKMAIEISGQGGAAGAAGSAR